MRKLVIYIVCAFLFFLVMPFNASSQEDPTTGFGDFDLTNPMNQQSSFGALLGLTDIGGEKFVGMRIQPEFVLGKLGFGLDVPFMFSVEDWKLRTEEFKDGVGLLRMIRYVSWGVKKRDPVYVRVGDLTGSWIGYGILLDNYTNQVSFEKRKMGATFDVLVKNLVGVEGLYSDFDMTSMNLLAIRPYVKPLGRTSIPVVKTIDFGFTYLTDKDQTKIKTDTLSFQNNRFLDKGMSAWALDMGVMPVNMSFMQLRLYAQYGKLRKNESSVFADSIADYLALPAVTGDDSTHIANYDGSSGFGIGVDFRFKAGGDALRVDAKLERLWYKKYFMPQFFNATYEFDKDARIFGLASADGTKGIYGALSVIAMQKVMVGGSLMIPDEVSDINPAILTLNLDASQLMEKFVITGMYVKGGLTGLKDAFKLDERSLLTSRVAYKMYKFLQLGVDYKWTWSKIEDGTFKATHYVTPYFGFQMPFNFGGGQKPINIDEE